MEFEKLILDIASRLESVSGHKKSIIQADLGDMSDDIEDALFTIKVSESNYLYQNFPKLKEQNIQTVEAIGLLFLSYLTYKLRFQLKYGVVWPIVSKDLMKNEKLTTFFHDNYFLNNHPNSFLKMCIEKACSRFEIRNSFDHRDDEKVYYNTILLQMGILNRFSKLNEWLSYSSFNH